MSCLLAPQSLDAQEPERVPEPVVVVDQDSLSARADTVPPISPLGAFGRSLVLPGWGQVEVGRPERGAIYFGAEAISLFMVFKSSAKLSAAKKIEPTDDGLVDSRTRQRENWIVMSVFIAFVSGLDAWVSTHFWDFEATIDAPPDGTARASVGLRVPVP
ncbi:MAG: hypothetical protein ACC682_02130 [Gemmatimonadota bacterium]